MATTDEDDGNDEIHPEFIEARVIELSGPSLKIRSQVELDIAERILVIFKIDEATTVQDIGEIRSCEITQDNIYLSVELVGLNEATITRLIKETNTIAIRSGFEQSAKDQEIAMEVI
jgi:hypothetical protein